MKVRGNEAIARIRRNHDPAMHAAQLEQIYLESCEEAPTLAGQRMVTK